MTEPLRRPAHLRTKQALVIALLGVLTSCESAGTSPGELTKLEGSYGLVSVNGRQIPASVTYDGSNCCWVYVGGGIVFRADGTVTFSRHMRRQVNFLPLEDYVWDQQGTYNVVSGRAILKLRVEAFFDRDSVDATINSDGSLSRQDMGHSLTYRK